MSRQACGRKRLRDYDDIAEELVHHAGHDDVETHSERDALAAKLEALEQNAHALWLKVGLFEADRDADQAALQKMLQGGRDADKAALDVLQKELHLVNLQRDHWSDYAGQMAAVKSHWEQAYTQMRAHCEVAQVDSRPLLTAQPVESKQAQMYAEHLIDDARASLCCRDIIVAQMQTEKEEVQKWVQRASESRAIRALGHSGMDRCWKCNSYYHWAFSCPLTVSRVQLRRPSPPALPLSR